MTVNRRARDIETLPDGRLVDLAAVRDWLADMDRRAAIVPVQRLAVTDPMCVSLERESRRGAA